MLNFCFSETEIFNFLSSLHVYYENSTAFRSVYVNSPGRFEAYA